MLNLFQNLESKKGETMAVAALRYLFMRNRPLREQFFRALGKSVSYSLYDDFDYFGCEIEVTCRKDGNLDNSEIVGWIDMVVESNKAVIGIEAKLGHRISSEQLLKYLPELQRRRQLHAKLRGTSIDLRLVLLVPDWQMQKAQEEAKLAIDELNRLEGSGNQDSEIVRIITWQSVIRSLNQAKSDPSMTIEDAFVLSTLEHYISSWSGEIAHFDFSWEAAYHEFSVGNPVPQREIVSHLSQFFPTGKSSMSTTGNYVGYNFSPDFTETESLPWDKVRWGWFGFIRNTYLKDVNDWGNKYQSAFCLFTDYLPNNMGIRQIKKFVSKDISGDLSKWFPGHEKYLWVFEESVIKEYDLKDPSVWYEILKPFLSIQAQ